MKYDISKKIKKVLIKVGAIVLIIFTLGNTIISYSFENNVNNSKIINEVENTMTVSKPKMINVDTPLSKYVTSGKRSKTTKIAFHYTGAHDVSGKSTVYNWFLPIAQGKFPKNYASAHFVMDLNGDIYSMIPMNYVAYTTNSANAYSIGVECATTGSDDHYSDEEYVSMVKLGAWLAQYYGLDPRNDFIRHYDVTQKVCPRYFVNNKSKWEQFKLDCYNYMKGKLTESNIRNCTNGKGNSIVSTSTTTTTYKTGIYRVIVDTLNVRSGAGTSYDKVGSIKKGEAYTIDKISGNWGHLKSDLGWICITSSYCEYVGASTTSTTTNNTFKQYIVRVTADKLNGRKGYGTSYGIETTLTKGTAVTIIEEKTVNGEKWGKTKSGYYICLKYTEFVKYV